MILKSVQRALRVLQLFTTENPVLGITEISKTMDLQKPTVQNLVETLVEENFLEQEKRTRRYKPTLRLYELGNIIVSNLEINIMASRIVPELANKTNCIVRVGMLDKDSVILTLDANPRSEPFVTRQYGPRAPLYCTALGKAVLAWLGEDEINAYLERVELIPYTSKTITKKEDLLKELSETRKRGYAINREEFLFARAALGAPIFMENENQIASISMINDPNIILGDNIEYLAHILLLAASEISGRVGSLPRPFLPESQ